MRVVLLLVLLASCTTMTEPTPAPIEGQALVCSQWEVRGSLMVCVR